METLKTDGLAYALEVAIKYFGMLHMLSTLKSTMGSGRGVGILVTGECLCLSLCVATKQMVASVQNVNVQYCRNGFSNSEGHWK